MSMSLLARIRSSHFFIKIRSWEYWPFWVVHAPLFPYWLWLSLKARSLIFFSASNPGILMGGMFGESKFDILNKVPATHRPRTRLMKNSATRPEIMQMMAEEGLKFPVIFKPDLGERGWMVKKISTEEEIDRYLEKIKISFLVQEFVDLPLEFGVFYVRFPGEPSGRVTSIVGKEMLSVTGDGRSTLENLIGQQDRAWLQWETLRHDYQNRLSEVILAGQKIELVSIGNHCLGTKFLNANHLINDRLSASFDAISKQVDGFYFGRYDLRTASMQDLEAGRVMVMELNGCGAEPAHIYHPGFSIVEAIRVLFRHWHDIYRVSTENHRHGVPYLPLSEARMIYRQFKSLRTQ